MKNRKKGFTLVELIVVLVILAVLLGILVPTCVQYIRKAQIKRCEIQRSAIARVFQMVSIENQELADCKDTVEVKAVLGDQDPIDYLADMGFYAEKEAYCPVYNEKYTLEVSTISGVRSVEVLCPCVESEKSYLALSQKIYQEIYKPGFDRMDLVSGVYNERGSLLKVAERMKNGSHFADKELYWRPYTLADGKVILYASEGNNGGHASWSASLLYVDGQIYQSTKQHAYTHQYQGTPIADLKDKKEEDLTAYLTDKSFEKISG